MTISRRTILGAAVCAASAAHAQAPPQRLMDLIAQARAARLAGDVAGWRAGATRVLELAPDHPDLLISAARANAAAGDAAEAVRLFSEAARRGAGFDPTRFPEAASLPASALDQAAERARANLAPVPGGARLAALPGPECEGVAFDPRTRLLFTGSSDGRVFSVRSDGAVETFAEGLQQVLGLKVDARRRLLWLVDGRFPNLFAPAQEADVGYSRLRCFSLDSHEQVGAWMLDERPALHGLNDMALARNGDVYVTDTPTGSVYRLRRGEAALELFFRGNHLTFINGLVLSADERRLYLAHVEGLSVLDLRARTLTRLSVPANASVNSIDGLAWLGRDLVGVQQSPYLARLARIRLNRNGDAVENVDALIARSPAEYSFTTCAVTDDAVVMVGGAPAPNPYGGPPLASEPAPHLWRVPV